MKNRIILTVVAIIVAVGGYLYVHRNSAVATVPVVAAVSINMDENGFSPDTITIKNHTQVVFKNVGTEPHWPASDIHPTHGIYPEFDPQRGIPPGESWSFVFTRVGKWRMHDHLMPSHLGTITVTE